MNDAITLEVLLSKKNRQEIIEKKLKQNPNDDFSTLEENDNLFILSLEDGACGD